MEPKRVRKARRGNKAYQLQPWSCTFTIKVTPEQKRRIIKLCADLEISGADFFKRLLDARFSTPDPDDAWVQGAVEKTIEESIKKIG